MVVQKIKGKNYLYEVESKWDSERKRSKQIRRYMGRCDEEGNLLQKKADKVTGRQFGPFYLRYRILTQNGIGNLFTDLYGVDAGLLLEGISILTSTHTMTPESFVKELPRTTIPDILRMKDFGKWNKDTIYDTIYRAYFSREELFSALKGNETEAYVLCSEFEIPRESTEDILLSCSPNRYFNRHLYQMVAIGAKGFSPFCYTQYADGAERVVRMREFENKLETLGIEKVTFLVKNQSDESIISLMDSGMNVICPVRRTGKLSQMIRGHPFAETIIESKTGVLSDTSMSNDYVYVGGKKCNAMMLLDEIQMEKDLNNLHARLEILKAHMIKSRWGPSILQDVCNMLGSQDLMGIFKVSEGENGKVHVDFSLDELAYWEKICGRSLFLTNTQDTWTTITDLLAINGILDYETIRSGTVYFSSQSVFSTDDDLMVFSIIEFLKNVVTISLFHRMKMGGSHITVEVLMSEINSIRLNFVNDKIYLDTLTEEQEGLFRSMGVRPPSNSYVRSMRWNKDPGI